MAALDEAARVPGLHAELASVRAHVSDLEQELHRMHHELAERMRVFEADLQESRALSRRAAELLDVVVDRLREEPNPAGE